MSNSYFVLTDSAGYSKKFGVLFSGYEPVLEKMQTIQTTVDGGLDVSQGGVYRTHNYTIRVRGTENREGYGNQADLEAFYSLNNPNAVPGTILTLTDHFGADHQVFMVGNHAPMPLGVMIDGDGSWSVVKCSFKFIPDVSEGSGS